MTRQFEVQNELNHLRQLLGTADALVHASEDHFNRIILVADVEDSRLVDRCAHLLGATAWL